jgi:sugar phosphate isomerase/epimerase
MPGASQCGSARRDSVNGPRVAVQLIIYGERAQEDLREVLREVEAAGYDGFEGGALASSDDVERVRAAMKGRELGYLGGHTGMEALRDPDGAESLAGHIKAAGGDFLMVSGRGDSLDEYRAMAATLTVAGERCRETGVTLCYHNHAWEAEEIEDGVPLHLLARETDPEAVKLCPDVYWLHVAGQEPEAFLARYRDRCACIHMKDGLSGEQAREFRELGRGKLNLKPILQASLACRPAWIVVEQDSTKGEPAESIRISREYLRSLGV